MSRRGVDRSLSEAPELEPISVRVPVAARMIGVSRSKLYELIGAGEIPTVKVGSSTLIPTEGLRRFIAERQTRR